MSSTFSLPSEHSAFYKKVPLKTDQNIRESAETIFHAIFSGDIGEIEQADVTCVSYPAVKTDLGVETEEDEEIPAWIRYLPKGLEKSHGSSSSSSGSGGNAMGVLENVAQIPKKVNQRPSSNPFGSTSLKATSVSRQLREKRLSDNAPYRNTQSREKIKDKLNRCNVGEASMLLSLSCIDKHEKQEPLSIPRY